MRYAALFVTIALSAALLLATGPAAQEARAAGFKNWAAVYGGAGAEEMEGLALTADGGLIVTGTTDSFGDTSAGDAWIVKLDAYGNIQWQKTYGGLGDEELTDVRQTADGGYITVGWTTSFGVSKTDMWVVKLDALGNIQWEKSYGGPGKEQAWSVEITSDGGYLVAGATTSFGAGRADYWVLKLDASGNIQWQKTYGGPRNDGGGQPYDEMVVQAIVDRDGNYVVGSVTWSFGNGASDIWVLKLDPNGNIIWQKAYGGFDEDSMWHLVEAADGGYIVPGNTVSFSPDYSGDMWVLKLDTSGNIVWQKRFAVPNQWDEVLAVGSTSDGGALIAGYRDEANQDWDMLLLRLDAAGNSLWQRRYEYGWDWPNAVRQTSDGGIAICAVGWPKPADLELWVLRLAADGTIGTSCQAVQSISLDVAATNATPTLTNGVAQATSVVPKATSAIVQTSSATPNFLCQAQPAENCANGIDDDGDGLVDCNDPDCLLDGDGDGFIEAPCGPDCDDTDPAVNPSATEICDNGKDDECDGLTDCDDPDCSPTVDSDGDGYFAPPCGTDCDDGDPAVNPGQSEICDNAKDDDCDGLQDCQDSQCMPLPVCTVPTAYCKNRSSASFNSRKQASDRAVIRMCVNQGFCDALAAIKGDATKSLRITVDGCQAVVVAGSELRSNRAQTSFKAKSAPGQLPSYLLKVNCPKLKAIFKLRHADLKGCVTNPLATTLLADGARPLKAEEQFSEIRDRNGNLKRLLFFSSATCTN